MRKRHSGWLATRVLIATGVLAGLFAGCAAAPVKQVPGYTPGVGERAARTAVTMIGKPYRTQGDSPSGFDCSGLVRYCYLTAGMDVPHGTRQLKNATRSIGKTNLRKGDLVFFNEGGKSFSHVGISLGGNLFVHAPSSGRTVRKDSLLDPYWKKSFIDARRFS